MLTLFFWYKNKRQLNWIIFIHLDLFTSEWTKNKVYIKSILAKIEFKVFQFSFSGAFPQCLSSGPNLK